MKKFLSLAALLGTLLFLTACSVKIPFDNKKGEDMLTEIKSLHEEFSTGQRSAFEEESTIQETIENMPVVSAMDISHKHFQNFIANNDDRISSSIPTVYEPESPIFSFTGVVNTGAESIEVVVYNGSGKKYDEYVLQKFKAGDKEWKYNVNPNFGNIQLGKNIYLIIAYFEDGEYAKYVVEVNFDDKEAFYENLDTPEKFCILDVCNYADVGYEKEGNVWKQKVEQQDDNHPYHNIEFVPGEYIKVDNNKIGSTKVFYTGDYAVKYIDDSFCGLSYTRKIEHKNGDSVTLKDLKMPEIIRMGNLTYGDAQINFNADKHGMSFDNITVEGLILEGHDPARTEGFNVRYLDKIIIVNNRDGIPVKYTLTNPELTNENKSYKQHFENGYLVVPKINPTNTEFKKYDLTDYAYTKNILETFLSKYAIILYDKDGNMLAEYIENPDPQTSDKPSSPYKLKLESNCMPVLSYYPINSKYDVIVTTRGHQIQLMAEMCKPAIYVYDEKNRNHKVSVEFEDIGHFTHLEPELNIKNGWEYQTKNGKVVVDGESFDYLYYAATVNNYKFNKTGRVVKGSDVEKFFEEALEKIGFRTNEKKDFLEYRVEKFEDEKYYFVSFKYNEEVDKYLALHYSKKPKTANRILMEAYEVYENPSLRSERGNLYQGKIDTLDSKLRILERSEKLDIFERGGVFLDRETGEVEVF